MAGQVWRHRHLVADRPVAVEAVFTTGGLNKPGQAELLGSAYGITKSLWIPCTHAGAEVGHFPVLRLGWVAAAATWRSSSAVSRKLRPPRRTTPDQIGS